MPVPDSLLPLIEKYQSGTATPEEIVIINEWYRSFDDSATELTLAPGDTEELMESRVRERILASIREADLTEKKRIIQKRLRRLSVAAAILLVLGSGIFYLLRYNAQQAAPAFQAIVKKTPFLAPGGNKAILTLADNSTIILDSANNGVISLQGKIKVEKQADGQLVYMVGGRQINENDKAFYNTISTPRGGQYQVTLSDGTKVWLNAQSSIRFPVAFTGHERRVEITGESYFEVTRNPDMPFRVITRGTEVEVLGTHFNINAYINEPSIKTTLVEGKVKVSVAASGQIKFLSPGQQSSIADNGDISISNHADIEEALAWKDGYFQFHSTDLQAILRQLERWYDADVEYHGSTGLRFSGQLNRSEDVKKLLEKIQLTGEVKFTLQGRKIIVTNNQ
ncbi:MAG TPA: FecR domain-containing protein [Sediminibacterium sp.]|nr:FecR domain-containing protein [Sediminibacterium sp.]